MLPVEDIAVDEVPEGAAVVDTVPLLSPKLTELFPVLETVFLTVVEVDLDVVSLKLR